jgi:hypothetical protein
MILQDARDHAWRNATRDPLGKVTEGSDLTWKFYREFDTILFVVHLFFCCVSALFIFRIDCRLYSLLLNDLSEAEKRNCRPLKENVVLNRGSREF